MKFKDGDIFKAIDPYDGKIYDLKCVNSRFVKNLNNLEMNDYGDEFGYIEDDSRIIILDWVRDKYNFLPLKLDILINNNDDDLTKTITIRVSQSKYEELLEIFSEETDIEVIE